MCNQSVTESLWHFILVYLESIYLKQTLSHLTHTCTYTHGVIYIGKQNAAYRLWLLDVNVEELISPGSSRTESGLMKMVMMDMSIHHIKRVREFFRMNYVYIVCVDFQLSLV